MTENPQEAIKKANRVKQLLADPIINETFDHLEKTYFESWRDTNPEEYEPRETLWQLLFAIGEVRRHLSVIMQRGEFHKSHLEKVKKRQKS